MNKPLAVVAVGGNALIADEHKTVFRISIRLLSKVFVR